MPLKRPADTHSLQTTRKKSNPQHERKESHRPVSKGRHEARCLICAHTNREEIEQSKYVFGQVADVPRDEFAAFHRDLLDRYYAFAEKLLSAGLILPALEYCLKCSLIFNILDSSGSVGVTERTAYVLKIRQLSVAIAQAYVAEGTPNGT